MPEPFYIAQNADVMTDLERRAWIDARAEEAKAEGATFFRASIHPEIKHLTLLEGWTTRPKDQGEPRWQLESIPTSPPTATD